MTVFPEGCPSIAPPSPPLLQPEEGYRYSIDSLLLADFANPKPRDKVLDIGAGCGVIAILLAKRCNSISVVAIELQEDLSRMAEENVRRHGVDDRVEVVCGDVTQFRSLFPAGSFDYVVSNPPFRSASSGRICPNPQEAVARHKIRAVSYNHLRAHETP